MRRRADQAGGIEDVAGVPVVAFEEGRQDVDVVLACLAAVLLLRLKLGIAATLAISASAALAWFTLSGVA